MTKSLFSTVRNHLAIAVSLACLAACAATDIEVEKRTIGVEADPSPAAAVSRPAIGNLINKTGPSYVTLSVTGGISPTAQRKSESSERALTSGSGFVVDRSGLVMTAAHVAVQKGNSVSARAADGRIYSGTVLAVLPGNDMALIKLKSFSGKAVTPASNACLTQGDMVYSLGKPHASGDVARVGELKSMHFGRAVQYGKFGYPDAMVLHMDTKKGESGGPLFNSEGRLAGMIVSTLADGNGRPLMLAHAIPATQLAAYFCQNGACGSEWQSLARQSTDGC